jgi:poly-gamma-glutamate capsule biosynthesis protein CapA/YwtB (metallophosphatase superfamily)
MKPFPTSGINPRLPAQRQRASLKISVTVFSLLFIGTGTARAQRVTFIGVGDICLAHGVEKRMQEKGSGYPFLALRNTLKGADITFGNLECCLALTGQKVPKKYNFRGHPRNAKALREAGFSVVSLANNHSLDYGKDALAETLGTLEFEKVKAVGAGRTIHQAHALRIVKVKGLRVGFLAYLGLFPPILPLRAQEPAVAMAEVEAVQRDVKAARPKVDILVVSMHAGKEYTFHHNSRQELIAHAAVDAGADMVIGHHPHVVQDSETYKGRPIFYSLGNFVFDPSPTFLRDGGKKWSGMVIAVLEKGKAPDARLVNLKIVDRQPRFATVQDAAAVSDVLYPQRRRAVMPLSVK